MSIFDTFERKHDYLVCVDSDGCVMDTMNCKHFHCFGPCMVTEWGLEEWKEEILDRWNVINLFSMTRGINRFKGLAMALKEIDGKYTKITGVDALVHWADTAPALSNDGVAKAACIAAMLKFGYDPHKVVMVGDAPGDCDAAEKNGVYYYPILVNHEKESWEEAIDVGFGKLQEGGYAENEVQKKKEFLANLGG